MSKPKAKKGKSANAKQNAGNATAKKAKNGGKKKLAPLLQRKFDCRWRMNAPLNKEKILSHI